MSDTTNNIDIIIVNTPMKLDIGGSSSSHCTTEFGLLTKKYVVLTRLLSVCDVTTDRIGKGSLLVLALWHVCVGSEQVYGIRSSVLLVRMMTYTYVRCLCSLCENICLSVLVV